MEAVVLFMEDELSEKLTALSMLYFRKSQIARSSQPAPL
jgi:hypothetical protein